MAGLRAGLSAAGFDALGSSAPRTTIPVRQQIAAISSLRWRLFRNGLRRKGGKAELAGLLLGYPMLFALLFGPVVGAGGAAYYIVDHRYWTLLPALFWAIFGFQAFLSINLAPPELNFDPQSLIRFPLAFGRFLAIRLFLGMMSVSTVAGTLALLSAALGLTIASPGLGQAAFACAGSLALTNMLLTRMVFAWVDRWMQTRRARELLTVVLLIGSVGFQYLNLSLTGAGHHAAADRARNLHGFQMFYGTFHPLLDHLPPGLAASAIQSSLGGRAAHLSLDLIGILAFGILFFAVFALRMQREYRGENLSEAGPRITKAPPSIRTGALPVAPHRSVFGALPGPVAACLGKEFLYIRRNTAQFFSVLLPLAMVVLFARRLGSGFAQTGFAFPAAVAYSLLGVAALSYNSLGQDGGGIQFYLLAPVPMRSVLVAKNLFGFLLIALEVVLVFGVLRYLIGPMPLPVVSATLAWILGAALTNTTLGNYRSIVAPKKVDPNKMSRKQVGQGSALLSIGLMLALAAFGAGVYLLGSTLHRPYLPLAVLGVLSAMALGLYVRGLANLDGLVRRHREVLVEELAKV